MKLYGMILLLNMAMLTLSAQQVELGTVNWMRDYDAAVQKAQSLDKAILILFQEVPGCATCRNYGEDVLSDPLLVDAIEHYFIPLVIFNNKSGEDKKILKKYNEPSWNNPVVRIVDTRGNTLIKRHAGNYTRAGLVSYMIQSFPAVNQEVPEFLIYLENRLGLSQTSEKSLDYSMYCFWSGEVHLGNHSAVVSTEAGFKKGKEVVRVNYDSSLISSEDLSAYASEAQCQEMSSEGRFRADRDPQYYLKQSKYRYLALSKHQRTKINSLLKSGRSPKGILSPSQLEYLNQIQDEHDSKRESLYEQDFNNAWLKMKTRL